MGGVQIFLVVMACAGDLLSCDDLSNQVAFGDMDACQKAREKILARQVTELAVRPQVFARCQYVLVETASTKNRLLVAGPAAADRDPGR